MEEVIDKYSNIIETLTTDPNAHIMMVVTLAVVFISIALTWFIKENQ